MKKIRLYKGDIVFRNDFMKWGIYLNKLVVIIDKKIDVNNENWKIYHSPLKNKIKRFFNL